MSMCLVLVLTAFGRCVVCMRYRQGHRRDRLESAAARAAGTPTGIGPMNTALSDEQWARTLNTNLAGAFYCTRTAATLLLKVKSAGQSVNITSFVGEMGSGDLAAYAARSPLPISPTKDVMLTLWPALLTLSRSVAAVRVQ